MAGSANMWVLENKDGLLYSRTKENTNLYEVVEATDLPHAKQFLCREEAKAFAIANTQGEFTAHPCDAYGTWVLKWAGDGLSFLSKSNQPTGDLFNARTFPSAHRAQMLLCAIGLDVSKWTPVVMDNTPIDAAKPNYLSFAVTNLRNRKAEMEASILAHIKEQLASFQQDTGLTVLEIELSQTHVSDYSGENQRTLVSAINCKLSGL